VAVTPAGRRRKLWTAVLSTAAVAIAVLAMAASAHFSPYWLSVLTNVAMLAILAQSWNMITGFAGYPAFGNVAFFGVGAYAMGVMTAKYSVQLPYLAQVLIAGGVAGVVCLIIGGPLMRVRGHYFAIGTIGLAVAIQQTTYLIPQLTTDVSGTIILPSFPSMRWSIEQTAYVWMVGILLVCTATAIVLSRSRIGFGLRAIRADEVAAATYGVPTVRLKLEAWVISAVFAGFAGAIWATWIGVITPASAYDLTIAVQYSVMALLGGLGTVVGPLAGALAVGLVGQLVWSQYPTTHLLVMGAIVMLTVLLIPNGLVGLLRRDRSAEEAPLVRALRDRIRGGRERSQRSGVRSGEGLA
jgi:branched-chain amino acid transport system permease protein